MSFEEQIAVEHGCQDEVRALSGIPITEADSRRIENVETNRFSEGGRGRSENSDRYILCLLDKHYQLIERPVNWFSEK